VSPARALYFAATIGVLGVPVWSVLREPLPIPLIGGILFGYMAFTCLGVFFLGLRMYTDAVLRGPSGARGVALTFDDGPHPTHTRKVLDTLDEAGAKGTFFVIGRKAEEHPEIVKEIVARGHSVGLHSYGHDRLFSLRSTAYVRRDLKKGMATLEALLGKRPRLFRPPIGHTNPIIARVVEELDLEVIGWSVGARDGLAGTTVSDVLARVMPKAKDGAIVLLHDAPEHGEREPAGVTALAELLGRLDAERMPVVPLATFLGE
jgi:peptidoglycan-N-acetylglucosamine deacetylase